MFSRTSYNRLARGLLSVALLTTLAACDNGGDARTRQIAPGITRDSLIVLFRAPVAGVPPVASAAADSVANIWRAAQYLVDGRIIEIIWYSRDNEHRIAADTVPEGKVFPVVLLEGKVVGAGRAVYDSVTSKTGIIKNKY